VTTTIHILGEEGRAEAVRLVSALSLDKKWTVVIKRKTKQRTLNQNALYWKWVGIVAAETGHTPDDIHEWAKPQFLTPKVIVIDDVERRIYSTKNLTTEEMTAYMDAFNAWSVSEMGIGLPIPEERMMHGNQAP
jgi:hypothetical protein